MHWHPWSEVRVCVLAGMRQDGAPRQHRRGERRGCESRGHPVLRGAPARCTGGRGCHGRGLAGQHRNGAGQGVAGDLRDAAPCPLARATPESPSPATGVARQWRQWHGLCARNCRFVRRLAYGYACVAGPCSHPTQHGYQWYYRGQPLPKLRCSWRVWGIHNIDSARGASAGGLAVRCQSWSASRTVVTAHVTAPGTSGTSDERALLIAESARYPYWVQELLSRSTLTAERSGSSGNPWYCACFPCPGVQAAQGTAGVRECVMTH